MFFRENKRNSLKKKEGGGYKCADNWDIAIITLKELLVCEIHVLCFLIVQLPVCAEQQPRVTRSAPWCINDRDPARTVADDHVFLGGSKRTIQMAIIALVLGSRLLSYLVLYIRFSFKWNCCKDNRVTKIQTKPETLKGNLLIKMCRAIMNEGRASIFIILCLTGSDWSGGNKIAQTCKTFPRRSSQWIKRYWWKTSSNGVSQTITPGHCVLSFPLCVSKWIIRDWHENVWGRENSDHSSEMRGKNSLGRVFFPRESCFLLSLCCYLRGEAILHHVKSWYHRFTSGWCKFKINKITVLRIQLACRGSLFSNTKYQVRNAA